MASEAYQKAFNDIVNAIGNPGPFAVALFCADLISKDTRDVATDEHAGTASSRAFQLVRGVEVMITQDSNNLNIFVKELRKNSPAGKVVADRIANGEYGSVDLPPPPPSSSSSSSSSSSGLRQRHFDDSPARGDTRKTAATDHDGSSMLRDIGMCVLFIVGATLVMWLGFMVVYSKLPVPKDGEAGLAGDPTAEQSSCHKIGKTADVFFILKQDLSINSAMEFGLLLGLSNPDLDTLKEDSGGKSIPFLNKIVGSWYNKTPPPACWETIYDALWQLPNRPLADKVKQKYMT